MKNVLHGLGICAAAVLIPLSALHAQSDFPKQPVKIVAANTAGTAVDVLTRVLALRLGEQLGQQFVIENKPGGGGSIGADAVVRSDADGYTLLAISPPMMAISPNLRKNLPYDPFKSFSPVSLHSATDNVLIINPKLPMKTVKDVVEYGKKNPGKLKFANGGTGFQSHLANLMFANAAGIEVLHVAYKGSGFVQGVAAGEADLGIGPLPAVRSAIDAGTVRAIAVASKERSQGLPDVPTAEEAGVKGFVSNGWVGLTAPAGTPMDIVNKLSDEVAKALKDEKTRKQLIAAGAKPWGTTPKEAEEVIREEHARYGKIIRDNKISLK